MYQLLIVSTTPDASVIVIRVRSLWRFESPRSTTVNVAVAGLPL